jgi:hypothetical protein
LSSICSTTFNGVAYRRAIRAAGTSAMRIHRQSATSARSFRGSVIMCSSGSSIDAHQ